MFEKFKRIIVPVDGSKHSSRALKKAINLGKKLSLPITAIYVIDMQGLKGVITPNRVTTMWKNILEEEGNKVLNSVQKQGLEKQIKVKTVMLEGTPDEEIIKLANKNDLVIMGSKGKDAIDRIFIGSISEKVLHHSDATVMIVR